MASLGIIVLAAGLGKRMRSDLPKVLHYVGGKPLLSHVLSTARGLNPVRVTVVVGHGADQVEQTCGEDGVSWIFQDQQLGTGHAVQCTEEAWRDFSGDLLILSGDVPLISRETLTRILRHHRDKKASVTFLTALMERPSGYGKIVRDGQGNVTKVVEERDATAAEKTILEVNAGVYAVCADFLYAALKSVGNCNDQNEYYLPDIINVALQNGAAVETVCVEQAREVMGINTREELAAMEQNFREKINQRWMAAGVTFKDPQTAYIDEEAVIGKDTVIGPNTHLLGRTVIGQRCRIDGNAYLTDARVGDEVHVKFNVVITASELEDNVEIGPFSQLRPGTVLKRGVHVGNFVEVKNSVIGEGTKASHLTYIGDSTIGRETNVGAGTITCNYDGFTKHRTKIGDRVQIGSDTQLVAPVTVGDDAYIGAGTTITEDIPAGALALSRTGQKIIPGWVERFRERHKKK